MTTGFTNQSTGTLHMKTLILIARLPLIALYVYRRNDTARYVDQGGGKRKGAFAMYLEPWHADLFEFLNLRKNHGKYM
ncbi:hypothetical protein K2173_003947 [Erythroxylum novogranatense]|uniref:Ribonucleotide reductase large subunit C-terminal domain-containing protein n=1 Tax=Erythroxylum novogranatense TaxID=1862640 RepID=A0AAV8SK01_9ROSI|nr:hypothetical protein K2173_003947 [Erythroxylum novogranatense]